MAYCAAIADPLRAAYDSIVAEGVGACLLFFSDDIKLWVHPAKLPQSYDLFSRALKKVGLSICRAKTRVWTPSPSITLPGDFQRGRSIELECLGARLDVVPRGDWPEFPNHGGEAAAALASASSIISTSAVQAEDLCKNDLSIQIAQALLRCVAHVACQHIVSTVLAGSVAVDAYCASLRGAWERVLGLKLSDDAWRRAQLPLREGDLVTGALDAVTPRAAAAFATAWSRTAEFVSRVAGLKAAPELLLADSVMATQLQAAADKLKSAGLPAITTP